MNRIFNLKLNPINLNLIWILMKGEKIDPVHYIRLIKGKDIWIENITYEP